MSTIHMLTDDIDITHTQSILGDGVQFLYFINTACCSGRFPPPEESVDYFLERLKLVVHKNTHPENLLQIIKSYCRGVIIMYILLQESGAFSEK